MDFFQLFGLMEWIKNICENMSWFSEFGEFEIADGRIFASCFEKYSPGPGIDNS